MSREVVDYEGSAYCKFADQTVTIIRTHTVDDSGSTGYLKTKVLCPYFYQSGWTNAPKCEKGGACGIAEGMNS